MRAGPLGIRRLAQGLVAVAALWAFIPMAHAVTEVAENDLKAAYAYNFMVLTTWPMDAPAAWRFCIAGTPAELAAFQVLSGKSVRERRVSLVGVSQPGAVTECSVLYVAASEVRRLPAWIAAVADRPVLTISDRAESGAAMVNLRLAEGQLVFDLNTRAAASARIQLSSQLMKLAATRR